MVAFCLSDTCSTMRCGVTGTIGCGTRVYGMPAAPVAQRLLQRLAHRRRVHVAHARELAAPRAVEARVEVAHLLDRHRVHVGDDLVEGARVAHVAARIRIADALDRVLRHRAGLLALLLDAGERRRFTSSSASAGMPASAASRRPARSPPAGLAARDTCTRPRRRRRHRQLGLQLVEPVLELLARQVFVPLSSSAATVSGTSPAEQRLLVAEAQRQHRVHRAAARALGQHAALMPPT
jgi:hypothetical protein